MKKGTGAIRLNWQGWGIVVVTRMLVNLLRVLVTVCVMVSEMVTRGSLVVSIWVEVGVGPVTVTIEDVSVSVWVRLDLDVSVVTVANKHNSLEKNIWSTYFQ
jgi:hypothetical protein